tara:strand:+ start:2393 stop:3250 length:858 start_codon:yes stop_codon:yes gene_type:complete
MIKSMTAYSSTIISHKSQKIVIEIKCLNSKNLDLNCKIPKELKDKESSIRKLISTSIQRGKVEFNMYYEKNTEVNPTKINAKIIKQNIKELKKIANGNDTELLKIAIQMPNAYTNAKNTNDGIKWSKIQQGIKKSLIEVAKYRLDEGKGIEKDITNKTENIKTLLTKVNKLKNKRIRKLKKKIKEDIVNLKIKIDQNRFEQELIYYIEKYDINEEVVRLNSHLSFFNKVINGKAPNGKKLGFISQEMGREINTIGAKSYDAEMQKIVVRMKDELEKIKEQIFNIL